MKKFLSISLTLLLLTSCSTSAQGLGGVLNSILGGSGTATEQTTATTTTTTTEQPTTASANTPSVGDVSGILSGVLGALGGASGQTTDDGKAVSNDGVVSGILNSILGAFTTVKENNLYGTWNFKGSAFVFESDNVLATLGSDAMAKQVAAKVDSYLAKVGVKEGACSITFNEDGTCTFNVGARGISGTYVYDASAKTIAFTFGLIKTTAYTVYEQNTLNIVFQSNALLKILKAVCAASSNSTLKLLNTLLTQYNGLRVGMGFEK
ncbi:MAG: DUF4923 family protein [Bacteroidaceae bacterium]|nr:DUF4923 family protein [Bacteroidaceae bacterium]